MKATEVGATKAQQRAQKSLALARSTHARRATERDSKHAAAILAIDSAIVAAERPEQTVAQLITALETLPRVGVGHGGWSTLMQHMPGYGLPLQEAVARMAACLARIRLRTATQAVRAVQLLLAAGGDVRVTKLLQSSSCYKAVTNQPYAAARTHVLQCCKNFFTSRLATMHATRGKQGSQTSLGETAAKKTA
jgi:hypothetical protein